MPDDIVTRLRNETDDFRIFNLVIEAADEIERLRAEIARLNTFLHPIGAVINQEVRGD